MMRSAKSVDWLSTLKCSGGRSVDKNSYGDHDNLEDEAFNSSLWKKWLSCKGDAKLAWYRVSEKKMFLFVKRQIVHFPNNFWHADKSHANILKGGQILSDF